MKGFIIYPTYRVMKDKSFVFLFGRLENGESFLTINQFDPYFFIETKNQKKAEKIAKDAKFEKTNLTNFQKEPVTKIIVNSPKEVPGIRSELDRQKIKTYEADIRFPIRFLIDNNIQGSLDIDGDYESNDYVDRIYKDPDIKSVDYTPTNLKIFSFDIESDKKGKQLYCISAYSKNYKKSFIVSDKKFSNSVSCKTEEELLDRFREELLSFDPDIITGWNLINFDLNMLKERFKKYEIPFNLGRDNSISKLRIEQNFFRTSKADISGRVVLDGIDLTKSSFVKLDNYRLNTVAKGLLGKSKIIEKTGKEKYEEIDRLYKKDQKKLIEYNLLDSELAYDVITKTVLMDLAIQRSKLTGMPLDRVNASIASLDFLYLQKARERKLVAPTADPKERETRIKGGYVMESKPGIYDNLIVLDFKSLYPSLIRTFNIDPSSYLEKKKKGAIESPNGAYFDSKDGILPEIIPKLWAARDKTREKKDEIGRYAIKILMNSFFGVLANPNCRFYNIKIANAITHFGQELIKNTAKMVGEKGYEVIYSDTDSIFIDTKSDSEKKAGEIGKKLEKEINQFYKKHIKKEYNRESRLELEYEKLYTRFMMPKIRGSEEGAKKRYAGLLKKDGKEKLDIVGLESVRGDWTEAAKKFQLELLDRIFHKKEVTKFVKKFVDDLREGKYDDELIYRKALRKGLEGYKVNTPHLKAARKLKKIDSSKIEYYITTDGPEPIQALKHKIDYEHYINKQIKPIAEAVLDFFDTNFDELIEGKKQTNLFEFN